MGGERLGDDCGRRLGEETDKGRRLGDFVKSKGMNGDDGSGGGEKANRSD